MVDFGSIKQIIAINDNINGHEVPQRSNIDHDGAEVSLFNHFQVLVAALVPAHMIR